MPYQDLDYGFAQYSYAPILFLILIAWSLFWKGWALWRAARNEHKVWYVVLLIINTVGILEILYIFIWGKPRQKVQEPKK
jgi:hypothetical protein